MPSDLSFRLAWVISSRSVSGKASSSPASTRLSALSPPPPLIESRRERVAERSEERFCTQSATLLGRCFATYSAACVPPCPSKTPYMVPSFARRVAWM